MGDDERRPPRSVLPQQSRQLRLAGWIDSPRRLVEDEHVGVGHEDGREREPLPLAAGKVAGMAPLEAGEVDLGQRAVCESDVSADRESHLVLDPLA